ncbi:hypothetical protein TIFTF001_035102 [Ficus carica]|uniref:Uncharacterized protein n=1 Tax=Ficus carica TaxID=3494 RepID=A0AA88J9F2_FICCA|nr:hypothetical protein TIFTF001_035102 [Ficus carica]
MSYPVQLPIDHGVPCRGVSDFTSLLPVLQQSRYDEVVDDRIHPSSNFLGVEYLFAIIYVGLIETLNGDRDQTICINPGS